MITLHEWVEARRNKEASSWNLFTAMLSGALVCFVQAVLWALVFRLILFGNLW